jgi:hypothetical protein
MPQHFAAIGFDVRDATELAALAQRAVADGTIIRSRRPGMPQAHALWDLGRGLQIWVALKTGDDASEPEIIGCMPDFLSKSGMELHAYRIALNSADPTVALVHARLDSGAQFQAVLADLALVDELKLSGLGLFVRLSGLALEAECWSRDEPPPSVMQIETQDGELEQVDTLFVSLDRDCHYLVQGEVTGVREFANFHSGAPLLAIGLRSMEMTLTVCCARDRLARPPQSGDHLRATIWLQAHLGGVE